MAGNKKPSYSIPEKKVNRKLDANDPALYDFNKLKPGESDNLPSDQYQKYLEWASGKKGEDY